MVIYEDHAKQSVLKNDDQNTTVYINAKKPNTFLKALQMEINETFRRYDAKQETVGKAFEEAVLHGKKGKDRINSTAFPDCQQKPFLLVMIHSTPKNFIAREAIRITWGRPQNAINTANAGEELNPRSVEILYN